MAKERKVLYFSDELNDEFSEIVKNEIEIDGNFEYVKKGAKGVLWKICSFIAYRVIMTPIAFFYSKIKFRLKVVGKKKLKPFRKKGVFIYGNHTLMGGDAFIPNVVTFPKKTYVVVKSANVSTFGTKNFILMNGAIPLPTKISGMRNFLNAVEKRALEGSAIMIYPEAHIWPYYTKIRPFKSVSFKYPVQFFDPVFSSTVTYQKRKRGEKPKVTVYIDGPFYPNKDLTEKEKVEDLRNQVYAKMCERAENSTYEYYTYIKKTSSENEEN